MLDNLESYVEFEVIVTMMSTISMRMCKDFSMQCDHDADVVIGVRVYV